jgi:ATP-dependent DNA helicase
LLLDGDYIQEEERLRAERKQQQDKAAGQAQQGGPLDKNKYETLQNLLNQTSLYSTFLAERINEKSDEVADRRLSDAEKNKEKPASGKGKKRKSASNEEEFSPTKELLPLMAGEMRDYQLRGVRWLISLYQNGLNGILADQMGLGKTVQTIGFLSHLRSKGVSGPYLIVGPLSVLPNWASEFARWCPTMPVIIYHGSRDVRADIRNKHMKVPARGGSVGDTFPVILTSFEIVMQDRSHLQRFNFKYVVVDEGHRLKNFDCKLIRELKLIPAANKLLLTGTPLQNNLAELWSLLHFLLPVSLFLQNVNKKIQ